MDQGIGHGTDGTDGTRNDGIERLRRKRGGQRVLFSEVADHMRDFCARHPDAAPSVDLLATFMARVEDVEHDHSRHPGRGMAPDQDVPAWERKE